MLRFLQGYMKRQALYACLTCTPDICDPAGFCLACNYHCHEGHNIVELYTKRFVFMNMNTQKYRLTTQQKTESNLKWRFHGSCSDSKRRILENYDFFLLHEYVCN